MPGCLPVLSHFHYVTHIHMLFAFVVCCVPFGTRGILESLFLSSTGFNFHPCPHLHSLLSKGYFCICRKALSNCFVVTFSLLHWWKTQTFQAHSRHHYSWIGWLRRVWWNSVTMVTAIQCSPSLFLHSWTVSAGCSTCDKHSRKELRHFTAKYLLC